MTSWLSRSVFPPRAHQIVGVDALLRLPRMAIFDEVGTGKTKQQVDAAQILYEHGAIDTVLVVAPGSVCGVWRDPDPILGEITKHIWRGLESRIVEYSAKRRKLGALDTPSTALTWIVTNYEFIRYGCERRQIRSADEMSKYGYGGPVSRHKRFVPGDPLYSLAQKLRGRKTWLVCDEAWALKGHDSIQTRACAYISRRVPRVTILNGTPVSQDPLDLYAQMDVVDPAILNCPSFFTFRARYATMGGHNNKVVIAWHDLDQLQKLIAPYVLRREVKDCLADLPPETYTHIEVPLDPQNWVLYKQMRDTMIAWLSSGEASVAKITLTKGLRLAQITAGFTGGVEEMLLAEACDNPVPLGPEKIREVGDEKIRAVVEFIHHSSHHDKIVIWCRFRPELDRVATRLREAFPDRVIARIAGGDKPEDREAALRLLAPGGDSTPAIVVGIAAAGGAGLNFGAADLVIYMTNDFNLRVRLQSLGRVIPRSKRPVTIVDVLATGPDGQKTSDHLVTGALRRKEDMATWTTAAWKTKLETA